jgi:cytochrome P450
VVTDPFARMTDMADFFRRLYNTEEELRSAIVGGVSSANGSTLMTILKDPIAVGSVMRSDNFGQHSMSERYRDLKRRTGLNFDATIQLMDFLPAFLDGDRHMKIRKAMARHIAASKRGQEKTAATQIEFLLGKLFVPPSEIELVSQFALPLWQEISASIVGHNKDAFDLINEIPLLFSPTLSIRERVKINGRLGKFIEKNQANIDDNLCTLGLMVLGAKPFVGSLALSLYQIIANNAGKKSNEIRWPKIFSASSLTFVDRVCKHATQIGNDVFSVGDRVRCCSQNPTYSTEQNSTLLFGLGVHTCLGKGISEFVWTALTEHLGQLGTYLVALDNQTDVYTEPFSMPSVARIAVR